MVEFQKIHKADVLILRVYFFRYCEGKCDIQCGMKKWIVIFVVVGGLLFMVPYFFRGETLTGEEASCELFITVAGVAEPLALEEYVKGVVAAEMPIRFELEALKAQAIAARTYAVRSTNYGAIAIEASTRRQVFKSLEERTEAWGDVDQAETYEEKLVEAVSATAGKVLMHEGELITAMFHASSNGQTESAENYGGRAVAYLQSVSSPEKLVQVQKFKVAELNEMLGVDWSVGEWQRVSGLLERNSSGRVSTVKGAGFEWSGREFRDLLGLRSTAFEMVVDILAREVSFTVVGYGHGVGMSQEGANLLAKDGMAAEEILKHYYSGVKIVPLKCE